MTKPYRMQRLGVVNHVGDVWSPETFDSVEGGQAYIDRAKRQNPTWDLSNHRVVPVRVTVSVVKPTPLRGGNVT